MARTMNCETNLGAQHVGFHVWGFWFCCFFRGRLAFAMPFNPFERPFDPHFRPFDVTPPEIRVTLLAP